jgi:hypothetical protein
MASRNAAIGTGVALAGLAGLAVAAVGVGAQNTATPLQPAADTVVTHTQVVHHTKRLKAHKRHDGRTVFQPADESSGMGSGTAANTLPMPATVPPATTVQSDDGASHDPNDDSGGDSAESQDD